MKYVISISLLLVLCGCEKSTPDLKQGADDGVASVYLNKPIRGKASKTGLYRLVRSGGLINDPSTSTGKSVAKPVVELVKSTHRIPLIKGAQMYLQYRIWPLPEQPAYADLRRVLKHPKMTLPNGKVSTGSDFIIKRRVSVNQAIGFTGYGFDEDYELLEGDWVFEIWYKNKKMIEQTFTTYRPSKQETAALMPVLKLGNKVEGGTQQQAEKNNSRLNWPRVAVGGAKPQS